LEIEQWRHEIRTELAQKPWYGEMQLQPVLQEILQKVQQGALLPRNVGAAVADQLAWPPVRGHATCSKA